MNKSINIILDNIKEFKIKSVMDIIPGFFVCVPYGISLLVCCAFWVYGWFSVLEQLFRYLKSAYIEAIKTSTNNYIEDIPLFVTAGIFTICWIPFFIAVLPLLMIGLVAKHFYNDKLHIKILIIIFIIILIILYRLFDVGVLLMRFFK